MRSSHLIRGVLAAAAIVAAALGTAMPASAAPVPPERSTQGSDEVMRALQRDLGLTPEEATRQLAAQQAARKLNSQLANTLGADFAGSWYDRGSGTLVVAISSAERAAEVRAAGAQAQVVANSQATLEAVAHKLDVLAGTDKSAAAGLTSWRIDAQRNAVVVTVRAGVPRTAMLAELGDAVVIEETDTLPTTTTEWLLGGNGFNGCSIGFNAFNSAGTRYFVTAGHCGNVGDAAFAANGVHIGTFEHSRFPGRDYAAVRVDNTAYWLQGPYVNSYDGLVYIVDNWFVDRAPIGTFVCKSGKTTAVTCGTVTSPSVSVNYFTPGGVFIGTVNGLTQHNACVEPGDSGGSNLSGFNAGHASAEGLTSGARMRDGRCLQAFGEQNVSWYQPVFEALDEYGLFLYTS